VKPTLAKTSRVGSILVTGTTGTIDLIMDRAYERIGSKKSEKDTLFGRFNLH
jgi:hypothetical protein